MVGRRADGREGKPGRVIYTESVARPFSSDPLTLPSFRRSFLSSSGRSFLPPYSLSLSIRLSIYRFLYGSFFPPIRSSLPTLLSLFLSPLLFWSVCVGSFYWAVLICDSFIVSLWCFCVVLSWEFSFVGVWVMACRAGFVRSFSLLFG